MPRVAVVVKAPTITTYLVVDKEPGIAVVRRHVPDDATIFRSVNRILGFPCELTLQLGGLRDTATSCGYGWQHRNILW
jgi:hypothetical protein